MGDAVKGSGSYQKRYTLPAGCSVGEFVMRELLNRDRVEIAVQADANRSSALPDNIGSSIEQRQHEAVRLSLVEVDGVRVGVDGMPYGAIDDWTQRTMAFALRAYNDLNGIDDKEEEDFLKGAEVVTSNVSPIKATTAP